MTGRIAFWLLLPALVLTVGAIAVVIDVAGDAPGENMFGGIALFLNAILLFVVLASMTSQALLIARRPQALTERSLPRSIAVLQLALYGVIGLWVLLLVSIDIFFASWLFVAAIITLSVLLLTRIQRWPRAPSVERTAVRLPVWLRVALSAYSVLAIGAIAYVIAALVDPTLDADGLRPLILLAAFGLPLSLVALPVALLGSLIEVGSLMFALPLLAIVLNIVVAQLLLWVPRVRVRLVNWFFRLGKGEEPATTVTGSSL